MNLRHLDGSRIFIQWREDGGIWEIDEGEVVAASPHQILVRAKGMLVADLISAEQIITWDYLEDLTPKLVRRRFTFIPSIQVRQHLADCHDISVQTLSKTGNKSLMKFHQDIDHSDLGHWHDKD